MSPGSLVRSSLRYYWRTNLSVVGAVAVAVGVLTGALLVGDSVRGSLRSLFVSRLGLTDSVVTASTFFRETLATEIASRSAPLIAFQGMVTSERTGQRRGGVQVYGVDERFWRFHETEPPSLSGRDVLLSSSLAGELGARVDDTILLRVETPSDVPRESLHGVKGNSGRTLRLTFIPGLESTGLSEFSLYPSQSDVRAAFVPLEQLQRSLGQQGRVNTVVVSGDRAVELQPRLEDLGVRTRRLGDFVAIESDSLMLTDSLARAVREVAAEERLETQSFLTYLANTLRVGEEQTPYSLVTAVDTKVYASLGGSRDSGIVLGSWLADDLGAEPGDSLEMEFYVWEDEGRIATKQAHFTVDGVVPMQGLAADRELAPPYPGISEKEDLSDWAPPFPIDLSRVRDKDEGYWDRFRATPKAFIPLARGQSLWPVREGKLTSIRITPPDPGFDERLLARLDPLELGFSIVPVREEGLAASRGATDFGEYFVYFSYFLVMAGLLLAGLFFKLGVEQRHREVGTLLATGFPLGVVRRLFVAEGAILATLGALLGILVAVGYAAVILYGLRTFWVDAVGTTLLTLHVEPRSISAGPVLGVLAALVATWLTLRGLGKIAARRLLAGDLGPETRNRVQPSRANLLSVAALGAALVLLGASFGEIAPLAVGFFGAGNLLLFSLLSFQWGWLGRRPKGILYGVISLGIRNASYRPGRSLVAIALIAFATFIIVAVDAFRKSDSDGRPARHTGNGGYVLLGEALLPLHWDPNSDEGRDALNLPYPGESDAIEMHIQSFRLRPGDDASCLNLYRPQSPRVIAPTGRFLSEGRFRFAASIAETPEERDNPWLLLRRTFDDGAVPVIGDRNSMAYVLHLGLGEDFVMSGTGRDPLRLRLVATLADSVFQGELLMGEPNFLAHFPRVDGFRYFLVETSPESANDAAALLETRLADFGFDASTTSEKLAEFHRVENTYLSTFQSLGGLGLVLGTFGLAAVLLRNVLERRRELALLRAVGYRRRDFAILIAAESALFLALGLATGAACALVAIAPAFLEQGGNIDLGSLGLLLVVVLLAGALSSAVAVSATLRSPLLASLREE
ncbi:MAG TPA: FtsX-like permease family protein [Vicinamibacteria bacterium]|nr:FtsX-like permease family protein [Vicinamibacteria bacterium]